MDGKYGVSINAKKNVTRFCTNTEIQSMATTGINIMKKRYKMSKRSSSRKFSRGASKTNRMNKRVRTMRGGTRL